MKWLYLMIGGIGGTVARYVLAGLTYRLIGTNFPYGTLAVNALGCLLVGFLAGLSEEKFLIGPDLRLLLMIGFCGAFTTFSTLIFESSGLLRDGENGMAFLNILLSLVLGFSLFWGGRIVGGRL